MNIPKGYEWLGNVGVLPKTISLGLDLLGTAEVVGRGSNKTILNWRDTLNQNGVVISGYSDDDIPWCGLFVAWVTYLRRSKAKDVVSAPLWALNWSTYGTPTQVPMLGDVLVFKRKAGGHVGFYIGEDRMCYHVLGGNQGNTVSITRIAKSRCVAARRPHYVVRPACVKPYLLAASGTVSNNEA